MLHCEHLIDMYFVLEYFYKTMTDGLKVTYISAGFDSQAVLVDENSTSVLKYKTPQFR